MLSCCVRPAAAALRGTPSPAARPLLQPPPPACEPKHGSSWNQPPSPLQQATQRQQRNMGASVLQMTRPKCASTLLSAAAERLLQLATYSRSASMLVWDRHPHQQALYCYTAKNSSFQQHKNPPAQNLSSCSTVSGPSASASLRLWFHSW